VLERWPPVSEAEGALAGDRWVGAALAHTPFMGGAVDSGTASSAAPGTHKRWGARCTQQ